MFVLRLTSGPCVVRRTLGAWAGADCVGTRVWWAVPLRADVQVFAPQAVHARWESRGVGRQNATPTHRGEVDAVLGEQCLLRAVEDGALREGAVVGHRPVALLVLVPLERRVLARAELDRHERLGHRRAQDVAVALCGWRRAEERRQIDRVERRAVAVVVVLPDAPRLCARSQSRHAGDARVRLEQHLVDAVLRRRILLRAVLHERERLVRVPRQQHGHKLGAADHALQGRGQHHRRKVGQEEGGGSRRVSREQ